MIEKTEHTKHQRLTTETTRTEIEMKLIEIEMKLYFYINFQLDFFITYQE